ncbi:MAG: class I SAM-dependent methyltransferase [Candidatus Bathyarchaeota archaeon]|nr:class I SAM-dependent methyltransferase [Candidatus Bathyarchaeota archaeon]
MEQKKINPKQKDFFNQKAAVWDQITIHNPEKVAYISDLLAIQGSDKILDVGTGTGVMISFYEKHLSDGCVMAIDYSEKMIEAAQAKYPKSLHPKVSFHVCDVYGLGYSEEFDLVVCYSCFPHFVDQPLAIQILTRALKKGGRLAVAHSDSADKINGVHMNGGVEIKNDFLPSIERLKQMMRENGLEVTFERDDKSYFICIAEKHR